MTRKNHFELLATYNQWINAKIYETAGQLSEAELKQDRGAFFGSILGTLNHIVVADTIWLKRFLVHPACRGLLQPVAELPDPSRLDQILFDNLPELSARRAWLDGLIIDWIGGLAESDLDFVISYRNMKGVPANRRFSGLLQHFFNHQTHHRGQVSTLLFQAGLDIGVTDLLVHIPDEIQE